MKTVIEMARETFDVTTDGRGRETFSGDSFGLERFAELVRKEYSFTHAQMWLKRFDDAIKAEREACAKVCEAQEDEGGEWDVQQQCANAIRARGETK